MKWWIHDLPKGIRIPLYQNKHNEKVTLQSSQSNSLLTLISYNCKLRLKQISLTCSWTCWQFKSIARAVAEGTFIMIVIIIIIITIIIIKIIIIISQEGRWQLINVKSIAVANTDEGWAITAPLVSCKTHFTQNSAIWHWRMSSTEPSRNQRTTVTLLNTCLSHLSSSCSTKTVPASQFSSVSAIRQNTMVICR